MLPIVDQIEFLRRLLKPVDVDEPTKLQERDVRSNPVVASGAIPLLAGCEAMPGATGSFGREPSNPIPVNGPIGECVYLSRLRSTSGVGFFFHRLGSLESMQFETMLDHFELVAIDASEWTELYLSPWHPRRSTQAPFGLSLRTWTSMSKEEQVFCKLPGFGVTSKVENFPEGLPEVIASEEVLAQISPGLGAAMARRVAAVLAAHPGRWHRPWERTGSAPDLVTPLTLSKAAVPPEETEYRGLPPVPPSTPPPRRGARPSLKIPTPKGQADQSPPAAENQMAGISDAMPSRDDIAGTVERVTSRVTPLDEMVGEICNDSNDGSIEASELGDVAFVLGFSPGYSAALDDPERARHLLAGRPVRDPFSGRVDRDTESLLNWLLGEEGREAIEEALLPIGADTTIDVLERLFDVESTVSDIIDGAEMLLPNEYTAIIRQAVVFGLAVGLIALDSIAAAESKEGDRITVAFKSPVYKGPATLWASAGCDKCDYIVAAMSLGSVFNAYLILDDAASSLILAGKSVFLAVCPSCDSLTTCRGTRNTFAVARCSKCGAKLGELDLVERVITPYSRRTKERSLTKTTEHLTCPRCCEGTISIVYLDNDSLALGNLRRPLEQIRQGERVHAIANAEGKLQIVRGHVPHELDFVEGAAPASTDRVVELTVLEHIARPRIERPQWRIKVRFERYVEWRSIIGEGDAND